MSQLPRKKSNSLPLRLTEEQRLRYVEAAERSGIPLATWMKSCCNDEAIWPSVLNPIKRWLSEIEQEYRQTTRPIDLSWEGWEAFVRENLHRMPRLTGVVAGGAHR